MADPNRKKARTAWIRAAIIIGLAVMGWAALMIAAFSVWS